jgi:acid phosphatase (class A)
MLLNRQTRLSKLLTAGIGLLLAGVLFAHARAEPQRFFRAGAVDPLRLLPAPAALETEEMKAELELVLRVQESRTPQEIERVRAEERFRLPAFQSVLGSWLNKENLPKLEALFERLEHEGRIYSSAAKKHFSRLRPFAADTRVKPLFTEDGGGYPSGHSMRGLLFASILVELAPDKKVELLARGRQIGWGRVIAGVHFPSDVAAGRTLGQTLAQELLANPMFRCEFAEIKEEFDVVRKRQDGR